MIKEEDDNKVEESKIDDFCLEGGLQEVKSNSVALDKSSGRRKRVMLLDDEQ